MIRPPDRLDCVLRAHDVVGAGHRRRGALALVLRRHDDMIGPREGFDRDQREDADRAGADEVHGSPRGDLCAECRVDGAGQGFDEYRALVAHPIRHGPELRPVCEHQAAPAAARLRAVPGLEPGLQMSHGNPVAAAHTARCAVLTGGLLAAGRAAEDARDHDALPGHEVADVVEELTDDLVAGHERERHER